MNSKLWNIQQIQEHKKLKSMAIMSEGDIRSKIATSVGSAHLSNRG